MQNHKRIPKRSLIGTRVSAPWSDGRFYCGIIESVTEQPNGQFTYSIVFDDGYSKLYFHKDIIGPGFNTILCAYLKHGQKVFVTHQGRELAGLVVKHNRASNEVLVEIECSDGEIFEIVRKLEDIRLLESRKSARLSHEIDQIRQVSGGIDVPRSNKQRQRTEDDRLDEQDDGDEGRIDSDMQLAAVALQNLSCSPASPTYPLELCKSPQSWSEQFSFRTSPSPPALTHSLCAPHQGFYGSASTDEGIEVEETIYQMDDDIIQKKRKGEDDMKHRSKLQYKCTWKGCSTIENNCDLIERHIRKKHLGPRKDNFSDHEEEFYYEEIERSELDEMTSNMEVMTCASPTQNLPLNLSLPRNQQPVGSDHDYNRKDQNLSQPVFPATRPILIPGTGDIAFTQQQTPPTPTSFVFPQNSPYSRQAYKLSPVSPTTSSPKFSGRKTRSDIKKCRKVYGMENKDLWCTQCKWKKACTRFVNENSV